MTLMQKFAVQLLWNETLVQNAGREGKVVKVEDEDAKSNE
jgi:hypothetical protein